MITTTDFITSAMDPALKAARENAISGDVRRMTVFRHLASERVYIVLSTGKTAPKKIPNAAAEISKFSYKIGRSREILLCPENIEIFINMLDPHGHHAIIQLDGAYIWE